MDVVGVVVVLRCFVLELGWVVGGVVGFVVVLGEQCFGFWVVCGGDDGVGVDVWDLCDCLVLVGWVFYVERGCELCELQCVEDGKFVFGVQVVGGDDDVVGGLGVVEVFVWLCCEWYAVAFEVVVVEC